MRTAIVGRNRAQDGQDTYRLYKIKPCPTHKPELKLASATGKDTSTMMNVTGLLY